MSFKTYCKLICSIALLFVGIYGAFHPRVFWILDGVNLAIHESGHLVFGIFGNEFLQFLGGTVMQLLMPLLFAHYFYRQRSFYSAAVMLFWVGENCYHIAPYIKDARTQSLQLVGGGIHDWGYLLEKVNALQYDLYIGNVVWAIGISIILISVIAGIKSALIEDKHEQTIRFSK